MMDLNSTNSDRHTRNMEHARLVIIDHVLADIEIIEPDAPDGDDGQGHLQFSRLRDLINRFFAAYDALPTHRPPTTIVMDNGEAFISCTDGPTEDSDESA